jgi:hypothetical protein
MRMSRFQKIAVVVLWAALVAQSLAVAAPDSLEAGWTNPPTSARLRAYWWWLNGNVNAAAITRDLEEMKAKGFGGAVLLDAGGADQGGNARVPHGPTFMTPAWRELYKHTLREADRLGLEMSLNILSGWNLGGPMVTPEDTVKKLTWSQASVSASNSASVKLSMPPVSEGYYRDFCVLAWPLAPAGAATQTPLENYETKALLKRPSFAGPHGWFLANSAPETAHFLLEDKSDASVGADAACASILDLTDKLGSDGVLAWRPPSGSWQVLRLGYTLGDSRAVSTHSDGWEGYALDVLDVNAFRHYWDAVVEPLIADAGPLAGKSLKYLHTDSWEVEVFNWTPTLPQEFQKRRGYDLRKWLPTLAGYIIGSREESRRFLDDFRRTMGDMAADNHYRPFSKWAAEHKLQIHPESGGPHFTPIDAQQCLGINDVPMAEFWAQSATHRSIEETRYFVKQPASAAHTMGHRLVAAEGFTTVGPHWQETLWDNLKPSFDQALCEGLNLLVWHAFVCSPAEMGIPGQQYFAGTHLNPNTTWWPKSQAFFSYIDRAQFLLQQGLFVADACYYYGDQVPNFSQLKRSDPARVLPGYDYDVISQEALLTRLTVKNRRLVLLDGVSYRVLVLPNRPMISLPVLRKLRELAKAGATILGPEPTEASGLQNYPKCDQEVKAIADELWSGRTKGRVIAGKSAREVLLADGVAPDFECAVNDPAAVAAGSPVKTYSCIDYVHRTLEGAEIYFVGNRSNMALSTVCTFRVAGKAPELWNAVTGERQFAAAYEEKSGRVSLPLDFVPCGSWFVVFREPARKHPALASRNSLEFKPAQPLEGAWEVRFDTRWGGPKSARFEELVSWTSRPEPGIRYYSGAATYCQTFEVSAERIKAGGALWLDIGKVRELAQVKLNGKDLGILWAPPFRVNVSDALVAGVNQLEVEVVNFWPNRIIGDQVLGERYTQTNVRRLTRDTPLMPSGLFGPVQLLEQVSGDRAVSSATKTGLQAGR